MEVRVRVCVWMLLILPLTAVAEPLGKSETERERNPGDLTPVRSQAGGPGGGTRPPSQHLPVDMPCAEGADQPPDVIREVLLALRNVWNSSEDSELTTEQRLYRFGFCLDSPDASWFSSLITATVQEERSLEYVQSERVHWHVEEDGVFTVTLDFANPGTCWQQTASMVLLFFIDSCNTDELKIQVSGRVLQPNNQTRCVSGATRFLILQTVHLRPEHIRLRMAVQSGSGKQISLAELQTIVHQRNDRSKSPVIVLFPKKPDSETVPRSNKTFFFLCELQKFLIEVSPPGNPLLEQDEVQTASPGVLHSLPPLTLGVSSSESLLLELVNSSGPTVFYFPQSVRLTTHRVELALKPSLVSVLKSKLDQALELVRAEEFGRGAADKLRVLSVLGALPEEPETDVENQREAQYRALLLLKALQAVLDARAVERAQRAARASQEVPTRLTQCHLESFTMSLEKYLLEPATANINNCEGACGFPLINGNNHAILLNSHLQSGRPLNRTLCCVPVAYDDLCVIELHSDSTTISYKTDMVAKECACR